ncbi:glycosyltransferase [Ancylobacter pratisalsi]|uniref:Glycosyltransferase family 4 protein n=1 Tax=Ancylobacter pratisalsi TaxID=1745854 RepID=A0A6P1YM55_9HYPH|nr:glycosyltransferase [Ancylobacter pratisalsi]QIB32854.1 glycosyltransferase family 4 protein [Ancylobacter pratisalsi]
MRIVFDVSDVIIQIHSGNNVGGILRVVTRLMRHARDNDAEGRLEFIFYHPKRRAFVGIDPEFFFDALGERVDVVDNALDLRGVLFSVNHAKYRKRPLRAFTHASERRLKHWAKMWREPAPKLDRPKGWALRPWDIGTEKVRIALLGMAWNVRDQSRRLAGLQARGDVEVVLLVHDLIPIVAPEIHEMNQQFSDWFAEVVQVTRRFIVISDYTGRDVAATVPTFGGQVEWIRRVPLAHEFDVTEEGELPAAFPNGFVLSIAPLALPRKNLWMLIKAWEKLLERAGPALLPTLVLAGAHGKKAREFEAFMASRPALAPHVLLLERPKDRVITALYRHCLFTVYPSVFEGWGLPVGEAAWFGKLCVASNATSVPEVVGSAADYFDPHDLDDMVAKLERPIRDRAYLAAREEDVAKVPLRRWEDVARDLVDTLQAP